MDCICFTPFQEFFAARGSITLSILQEFFRNEPGDENSTIPRMHPPYNSRAVQLGRQISTGRQYRCRSSRWLLCSDLVPLERSSVFRFLVYDKHPLRKPAIFDLLHQDAIDSAGQQQLLGRVNPYSEGTGRIRFAAGRRRAYDFGTRGSQIGQDKY
jgi:hypothetical protein